MRIKDQQFFEHKILWQAEDYERQV